MDAGEGCRGNPEREYVKPWDVAVRFVCLPGETVLLFAS